MNKIIGILLFLCFSGALLAQPNDAKVETINGKKYYVHIVEAGNTIYGIHQLYDTSVEDILNSNDNLDNDLTIGQRVLIPISTDDSSHYGTHIVSQGETLYGISKKYGCSVQDLKNLNPGIEEGIVPNQEIKIPSSTVHNEVIQDDPVEVVTTQYQLSYTDSIVYHTVLSHETMYSISKRYMVSMDTIKILNGKKNTKVKKGDVLKIPVKKVNYSVIEKDVTNLVSKDSVVNTNAGVIKKDVYNVALMLPFMFNRNDVEMSKPLKIDQVRELYPTTKITFEFYQGFVMALDSLTKTGLNVNLYVYDTKKDTNTIGGIFKKAEFNSMDIVVGPLYNRTIKYTANICKERKIKIVLPFKADSKVLHENPYVFKTVSSNMTLVDGIVDYIIENHSHHNILLFKPTSTVDKALYERVRERFNSRIQEKEGAYNTKIIEVNLGSKSGRELNGFINKDTANIFIIPSVNVKFVSGAMMRLNSLLNLNPYAKNLRVTAYGLEDWNQYDDLDVMHRVRLNQHYASYRYVDYNKGSGLDFVKAYRARYGVDPTVYATQGFDIGLYFMGAMHLYGTNFEPYLGNYKVDLIQNDFNFLPVAQNSGRENSRVCMVMYSDYKLVPLD